MYPVCNYIQVFSIAFFFVFQDEAFIYTTFTNEEFVTKLISFLSLEENKGKDQFDTHRACMFKVSSSTIYYMYSVYYMCFVCIVYQLLVI